MLFAIHFAQKYSSKIAIISNVKYGKFFFRKKKASGIVIKLKQLLHMIHERVTKNFIKKTFNLPEIHTIPLPTQNKRGGVWYTSDNSL